MMEGRRYWVIVASKDHIQRGIDGGFVQANHGKAAPLKRMRRGDWVLVYSPKVEYGSSQKLQAFTAIAQVTGEDVYSYDMGGGFVPYRREAVFHPCQDAPIEPLISELSFIRDAQHWGAAFRFGFFEIAAKDFMKIANAMGVQPQEA